MGGFAWVKSRVGLRFCLGGYTTSFIYRFNCDSIKSWLTCVPKLADALRVLFRRRACTPTPTPHRRGRRRAYGFRRRGAGLSSFLIWGNFVAAAKVNKVFEAGELPASHSCKSKSKSKTLSSVPRPLSQRPRDERPHIITKVKCESKLFRRTCAYVTIYGSRGDEATSP